MRERERERKRMNENIPYQPRIKQRDPKQGSLRI